MIVFSNGQMQAFDNAAFNRLVDRMEARIKSDYSMLYQAKEKMELRRFIRDCILQASDAGFYSEKSEYSFLRLCVEFGVDFDLYLPQSVTSYLRDSGLDDVERLNYTYKILLERGRDECGLYY